MQIKVWLPWGRYDGSAENEGEKEENRMPIYKNGECGTMCDEDTTAWTCKVVTAKAGGGGCKTNA